MIEEEKTNRINTHCKRWDTFREARAEIRQKFVCLKYRGRVLRELIIQIRMRHMVTWIWRLFILMRCREKVCSTITMFKVKREMKTKCRSMDERYIRYIRYATTTKCVLMDFKHQTSQNIVSNFLRSCHNKYMCKKAISECSTHVKLIVKSIRELMHLNKLRLCIVQFVFMEEFDLYR